MAWRCPYCQGFATLTSQDQKHKSFDLHDASHQEPGSRMHVSSVRCPNPKCRKITVSATIYGIQFNADGDNKVIGALNKWSLLPESLASPQPDCIPQPIRDDYYEACLIRDKSPKASATLSRRCLQGMIRDFCGISRKRLIDEIDDLRDAVDQGKAPKGVEPETLDAIDHIRSIGNIGAHMEADINVIVDVDPEEAQKLIELIELLFAEWYVAREKREERIKAIGVVAAAKAAAKKPGP